jgi:hypothetical protein
MAKHRQVQQLHSSVATITINRHDGEVTPSGVQTQAFKRHAATDCHKLSATTILLIRI